MGVQALGDSRFTLRMTDAAFEKKRYHMDLSGNKPGGIAAPAPLDQFVRRSARVTFGTQAPLQVTPQEKLNRMAHQLAQHQLDAYYIPPEDEHLNEYLPENKKRIEWLTGFTGESAPLLVTPGRMHLYVDGRFHIQVDQEVDKTVVEGYKLGPNEGGDRKIADAIVKLAQQKGNTLRVGYDPFIVSPSRLKALKEAIPDTANVLLVPVTGNLVDPTWSQRPASATTPAFALDDKITGRSVTDKLNSIRAELKNLGADVLPVTKLDEVAWLYNIRGGDIPNNPVVESYAIVTQDKAYWFVPSDKVPADLKKDLTAKGVMVAPYDEYSKTLKALVTGQPKKPVVLIDKGTVTEGTLGLVKNDAVVLEKDNPVSMQKALKNPTEIDKMLLANFRASRAIIRHLAAVDKMFKTGKPLNEVTLRADIEDKYKQEPEFFDLSFPTIPGVGSNSAIIHYSKADPNKVAKDGEFYLVDSGCQYLGGTTDTTRTTVFGQPRPDQIQKFTAVLKAHIAAANMRFPEGTNGAQIDAVCRDRMWQEGLDFGHGTGHGVGAFLNVHEGPNRISRVGKVAFQPGMVTSIEPGYYQENWGGIRLENLYYVAEDKTKAPFQGNQFYKFEHLTFVPFEKKLIDTSALTKQETDWLKAYYQEIWNKMAPTLSPDEQAWLKDQITL